MNLYPCCILNRIPFENSAVYIRPKHTTYTPIIDMQNARCRTAAGGGGGPRCVNICKIYCGIWISAIHPIAMSLHFTQTKESSADGGLMALKDLIFIPINIVI